MAQLNEQPRRVLRDLIRTQGVSLCEEPARCKAFLNDLCAAHGREVDALLKALEKRVPAELSRSSDVMPKELLIGRLTERLYSGAAIDRDSARWAVESWALALGRVSDAELISIRTVSAPEPPTPPVATPRNTRPGGPHAPPSRPRRAPPAPTTMPPAAPYVAAPPTPPPPSPPAAVPGRKNYASLYVAGAAAFLLLTVVVIVKLSGAVMGGIGATSNTVVAPSATPPGSAAAPAGMLLAPGGDFRMGNDGSDGDELERPSDVVHVAPFFIDTYEVLCSDYERFLREKDYPELPDGWSGRRCPAGRERLPVAGVNWFAARAYCEAQRPSKRLPTEKEWEFAARGTTGWRYPWGDTWVPGLANAGGASGGVVGRITKGASPVGAYDMAGNVWEWTESDLVSYAGTAPPPSVTRGGVVEHVVTGKVIRGGSWQDDPQDVTTTIRRGYPPRGQDVDYSNTGFRCALSAP